MNDTELDELLSRSQIPSAPPDLRGKVWRAVRPPHRRRFWRLPLRPTIGGTVLAASLSLLLLITQALPQTLRVASPLFRIPFTVDFEFINYDDDGSSTVDVAYTSYPDDGTEV